MKIKTIKELNDFLEQPDTLLRSDGHIVAKTTILINGSRDRAAPIQSAKMKKHWKENGAAHAASIKQANKDPERNSKIGRRMRALWAAGNHKVTPNRPKFTAEEKRRYKDALAAGPMLPDHPGAWRRSKTWRATSLHFNLSPEKLRMYSKGLNLSDLD
jgi:hypothetical protein